MTGKKVCKTLPDHLVERIIAMMPFPSIFRARCLSKSWDARFSSITSQDDEAKKRIAIVFQKLVGESSRKWKTFCPVFISMKGELLAYDLDTHNWQKMPSVSFLPKITRKNVQIEGALLYASDTPSNEFDGEIYVANILTRAWKRLPPPPSTYCEVHSSKLVVIDRSSKTYKLILLCKRNFYIDDFHFVQIYDSKSESWSSKKVSDGGLNALNFRLNSVYFNGVLYMASPYSPPNLWALNIEEGTLEERDLSFTNHLRHYQPKGNNYHLVDCDTDLFMVVGRENGRENKFERVLDIDVRSLKLDDYSGIPSSPAAVYAGSTAMAPIGDYSHIFFGYRSKCGRQFMRAYNFRDKCWSCLCALPTPSDSSDVEWGDLEWGERKYNWIASFQPSLSPFLAV